MAAVGGCMANCTRTDISDDWTIGDFWEPLGNAMDYLEYQPWFFSLLGSAVVGLSGIFPLLIIPIDHGIDLKNGAASGSLKVLLSFAVGGLLGDVFLHLLPESWAASSLHEKITSRPSSSGLWVLSGFLLFVITEKIFSSEKDKEDESQNADEFCNNKVRKEVENNNSFAMFNKSNDVIKVTSHKNGYVKKSNSETFLESKLEIKKNGYTRSPNRVKNGYVASASSRVIKNGSMNGFIKEEMEPNAFRFEKQLVKPIAQKRKRVIGYLNLMANCVDNFTHGLAVGGSFLVSFRVGALTTIAILIHEIPHEIGDFAILLKSGFSRLDAAKAQLLTASGGICGALVAVMFSGNGVESRTSWILPFTAGGFLHIGLVTVLPEFLEETDLKESLKQLAAIFFGIFIMGFLATLSE